MPAFSFLFIVFALLTPFTAWAQSVGTEAHDTESTTEETTTSLLNQRARAFFSAYRVPLYAPSTPMRFDSLQCDDAQQAIRIFANESFFSQPFTPTGQQEIKARLSTLFPAPYHTYQLSLFDGKGRSAEQYIPAYLLSSPEQKAGRVLPAALRNTACTPWVVNLSRAATPTEGLTGEHLYVSPSHGRYYKYGAWQWQRPHLFCTTEDLFTQSIVFPYLIPMLENAGAVVYSPRERDAQTQELIIDNLEEGAPAYASAGYEETDTRRARWQTVTPGFRRPTTLLPDSAMPFTQGTARAVETTTSEEAEAAVSFTPCFSQAGRYAVYVSYAALPDAVRDAHFSVHHLGGVTHFAVNQQMGGGTWVYLGTFAFAAGASAETGCVRLDNRSQARGRISIDAVRFGGGVGQTLRAAAGTSGLPRRLEAARYQAQWCGLPDSLWHRDLPDNDYNDDIRARSLLLNYLAGGSAVLPTSQGLHVPFTLALSLHSDAGIRTDGSPYGSLAICSTRADSLAANYPTGLSRLASLDLGACVLSEVCCTLRGTLSPSWPRRELWDRNYGEARSPQVPATILETLSHQNFADLCLGFDPQFNFTLARAVYKGLLRYCAHLRGTERTTIQPLPPHAFAVELAGRDSVRLSWQPSGDPLEPTAVPTAYIIYKGTADGAFDNGTLIPGATSATLPLPTGVLTRYRISAVNAGGESFPTETLVAYRAPRERRRILVVNGFTRTCGPARISSTDSVGFDLYREPPIPYLSTLAYCGAQRDFNPSRAGSEGEGALGYSGNELEGRTLIGNTFNNVSLHAAAIAAAAGYSIASASLERFEDATFTLTPYAAIDYIAGLQRQAPQNLRPYPALSDLVQLRLTNYLTLQGGSLLLSGSYIGSDLDAAGRDFAARILKYRCAGSARCDTTDCVNGLNLSLPYRRRLATRYTPSATGYTVPAPDILLPASTDSFSAFAYGGGQGAGVAYRGASHRVIATGFPLEAISEPTLLAPAMKAMLTFLTE